MKFAYPKKQWVMTTALLAVLGFNVSFNSNNEIAFADFASTETVESNVPLAQGNMPVKYFKDGDNKVTAIVSQITEGKICETCDKVAITLNASNTDNIENLNVLLVQALSAKVEEKETKKEEKKEKKDKKNEKKKEEIFATILDDCGKKDEDSEKLECVTPKFLSALKKNKDEISEDEAMEFYKDEIESLIKKEVHESNRISIKNLRDRQRNSFDDYGDEDEDRDASEVLKSALDVVKELHSEIPAKYKDIRKRLLKAQTEIVDEEALQVQRTVVRSSRQTNSADRLMLHQEAVVRNEYLKDIIAGLSSNTEYGLDVARSSGLISGSDYRAFGNAWDQYSQVMGQSMNRFLWDYAATGKVPTSVMSGASDLGGGYSSRIANPGRTGQVISRGETFATATGTNPVVITAPKENVGISFGEMTQITSENRRMRDEIRKVFGK